MKINHLRVIAEYWDRQSATYIASHPEYFSSDLHPSWGLWHIPEKDIALLSEELIPGRTLVDLGCGAGHDAVAFAGLGLNVFAIDLSERQLSQAIRHPGVQYLRASAERVPLRASSVDIAVSDHGAFDHSPPKLLLKEMYRILRPGGVLVVCTYSPLAFVCYDPHTGHLVPELKKDYPIDDLRFDGEITASELSYSSWVRHFREHGFCVERLEELMPREDVSSPFSELVTEEWARRWPCDIAWVVRKPGSASQDEQRR